MRINNMKKVFLLIFANALLFLFDSCQTMATYSLSDEKLVALVVENEEPVSSGNIVFTEKGTSIFSKIYHGFKSPNPAVNEKTVQIVGCRTFSGDKGTIRTSSADSTINTLMGIEQHDYEWTGNLIYDDKEVPVWYHFWVAGSSRGTKEYELDLDYCDGKKATFKDKLNLFEYYVPEDASILTMQSDLNNFHKKIPLLVAKFKTNSGSEYCIYATRSKKYEKENLVDLTEEELEAWSPKITSKEIILDNEQVFQITNEEKSILFAECSKDSYRIYSAVTDEIKNDVNNCIGTFMGYLWAIDEHERTDRVLTTKD